MPKKSSKKKLLKYIQNGHFDKFKSYMKKHHIDAADFRCDGENSLLHVACQAGHDVIVRYLLSHGADVTAANMRGQLPLHVALLRALEGDPHAYTDIVQPVLFKWSAALEVGDDDRVTPRRLLERYESRSANTSQPQVVSSDSSSEDEWRRKLADEAGMEYEAEFGKYHQNSDDECEPTEWGSWADSIREAHHRKRRQQEQAGWRARRLKRKQDTEEEMEAQRAKQKKLDDFHRKLELEHQQYLDRAKLLKTRKLIDAKTHYEISSQKLFSSKRESHETLGMKDIVWPFVEKVRKSNRNYGCASKEDTSSEEMYGCTEKGIKMFLLCDLQEPGEIKKYLKEQQVRWHPDRFLQKCSDSLKEDEKGAILDRVKLISQVLNKLVKEPK